VNGIARRWRELSATTRCLCTLALVGSLAANALLFVLPRNGREVGLAYAGAVLLFKAEDDSWMPMNSALRYLSRGEQRPLYDVLVLEKGTKFQYPPTSLLLLEPLVRAPYGGPPNYVVPNAVSLFAVLGTMALSIVLFERRAPRPTSRVDTLVRVASLALLALTFYPLTRAFVLGQIQTWINFGVALLLAAWFARREATAGVIAALLCLVKPHYGLLFVWAAMRRRWRMLRVGLLVAAAVTAISVVRYGLGNHLNYLSILSYLSQVGESFYANQSVNGLVNRMLFVGNNLEWLDHSFPPFNEVVYGATVTASVVLLGMALLAPVPSYARGGVTDLMIMLLSITMASAIAWEHHYGILLPMFALVTPAALRLRPFGRWTVVALVAAYELVSLRLSITDYLAATHWNFLQSYVFAGAVLFLVLLYRLRADEAAVDSAVSLARSHG
jgi:hypothetical protein